MSMSDLERFFQLVEANEADSDFEGEKSSELIKKAEKVLGLAFPPTYQAFLKRYGCGDIAGFEIYGILHENFNDSGIPDAVWLTLDERRSTNLPLSLVLVSDVGDGSYYAIDCGSRNDEGDCPVVIWTQGGTQTEQVHSDFGEFARSRLENAVG